MAKRVSKVEDGFAAKRQRENAYRKKRKAVKRRMHDSPSASEARSFTLSNPTSKRAIADYVESQARSEKVQHAEKVKSEHLFDRDYDCWDVHTQRDRYWVITSPSKFVLPKIFSKS